MANDPHADPEILHGAKMLLKASGGDDKSLDWDHPLVNRAWYLTQATNLRALLLEELSKATDIEALAEDLYVERTRLGVLNESFSGTRLTWDTASDGAKKSYRSFAEWVLQRFGLPHAGLAKADHPAGEVTAEIIWDYGSGADDVKD